MERGARVLRMCGIAVALMLLGAATAHVWAFKKGTFVLSGE